MLPVQTNEDRGAAEFLRNAAGHDAHDALMPAFFRQHDGFRRLVRGQHGNGLPVNFLLDGLPLGVHLT